MRSGGLISIKGQMYQGAKVGDPEASVTCQEKLFLVGDGIMI